MQEAENLWSTKAVRRIAAAGRWVRAAGGAVLLVDRPVGERDPAAEPRGQAPGLQIVLGESNQLVGLRAAGCGLRSRAEAEHALLRYIVGWYNPRRIQAGLGVLSPEEYEDAYHRHTRPDPHR